MWYPKGHSLKFGLSSISVKFETFWYFQITSLEFSNVLIHYINKYNAPINMPHFSQSQMLLYLSHLQIHYVTYFARYPKINFLKLDKMDIAINQNCNVQ